MQSQINAIAQLLKANNATASLIEEILTQVLSTDASWENTSTVEELPNSLNQHDLYTPDEIESVMRKLWRSRIDLNDARHHAELVDLEDLLSRFDETEVLERDRQIQELHYGK